MSRHSIRVAIGQAVPVDLPEHDDGSPHEIPLILRALPLRMLLPADIGPAHEQALMTATPSGRVSRLICLQAHAWRLESTDDPERVAYLPLLQVSIYLRGVGGPLHRPLHWIGSVDVLGRGDPHGGMVESMRLLADHPTKGPPATLIVTGRDRRLLAVATLAMHNAVASSWARALQLAASHAQLERDEFPGEVMVAESHLLPLVQRDGCMCPLVPVAIGGHSSTVEGQQLQRWLIRRGWLHPQQVAVGDDAGGGL